MIQNTETKCKSSWIRRCKWEARYDEIPPSNLTEAIGSGVSEMSFTDKMLNDILRNTITRHYVRDICTTCGATRERVTQNEKA